MKVSHINIIEHPSMPRNEAQIICDPDSSQLPPDLRDSVSVPCIVTGDLSLTKSMLTLMMAHTLSDYLDTQYLDEGEEA